MSQVIDHTRSQSTRSQSMPQINPGTTIKEGGDILSGGMKEDIENEMSFDKMENLKTDGKQKADGKTSPKPESTLHKVGRYLTKILGGLLLLGGIAAAAVATVASCGIGPAIAVSFAAGAAGIFGGITGTSLLAGAAGAAGIGLIATSGRMKPTNPGLLQKDIIGGRQQLKPLKVGKGQIEIIEKSLMKDKKYNREDLNVGAKNCMDSICGSLPLKEGDEFSGNYAGFVEEVLGEYEVEQPFQVNEQNVLLVRLAINQYFDEDKTHTDAINSFNNEETRKSIADYLKQEMERYKEGGEDPDPEYLAKLQIFHTALTGEFPKEAPIAQGPGINDIINDDDDVPIVPMQEPEPEPDLSKILPKNISFGNGEEKVIMKAIKTIDPKFDFSVAFGNFDSDKEGFDSLDRMMKYSDFTDGKVELFDTTPKDFVEKLLTSNKIDDFDLTPKNVLIVRCAIGYFFEQGKIYNYGWTASYNDVKNMFSSPKGQQQIYDNITKKMEECKPGDKNYKLYAIFRAAISVTDLSKLKDENAKLLEEQTSFMKA